MKNKFKKFLEEQFRTIPPTKNAMEYRKRMLHKLMIRAQELQIKGIDDENLIYNICIEELGDFNKTLVEFQNQQIKTHETKRQVILAISVAIAVVFLLVVTYLIVGGVTSIWHPTWLIPLGGIFAGITITSGLYIFNKNKKNKILKRFFLALDTTLITVFLFLLLQVGLNINGSWQAFLVLPMLLFGIDTLVSFIYKSKVRWIEFTLFIEVFAVMLYVLLGLNISNFWHPGWLLCLSGVIVGLVEICILSYHKVKLDKEKENKKIFKNYFEEDEHYYTEWDD